MAAALVIAIAGCAGTASEPRPPAPGSSADVPGPSQAVFADDELEYPAYGKAELSRVLGAERELIAQHDRRVAALAARATELPSPELDDQLRIARADLAVRRRFVAMLEICDATSHLCPPRLDEPAWSYDPESPKPPPMTAPLRFDVASWRTLAAELGGRACACRTRGCVDSLGAVIDQLEPRPMREVQGDEAATASVTAARQCLARLGGRVAVVAPRPGAPF